MFLYRVCTLILPLIFHLSVARINELYLENMLESPVFSQVKVFVVECKDLVEGDDSQGKGHPSMAEKDVCQEKMDYLWMVLAVQKD